MKSKWVVILSSLSLLLVQLSPVFAGGANTRQEAKKSEPDAGQKLRIGTSEVLLDVVVRDKKGRPVKDLGEPDFQVYEDGVKQDLQSFRVHQVESGEVAGSVRKDQATAAVAKGTENALSGANFIALVFDRLSPEARESAHKAALSYVDTDIGKDDFAGVFGIDLSLQVFQPFTNNGDLIAKAIDRAAMHGSSAFQSDEDQIAKISNQMEELQIQEANAHPTGPTQPGGGGGTGQEDQRLISAKMTLSALEGFEELERDQQGYATTNGLLAVINSLRSIKGRKAIVFLSEGLALRPEVVQTFRSVINEANRANVSIYAVDAAGLRTTSTLALSRDQTNAIGATRMLSQENGKEDTSGHPMTKDLERNEDVLHMDPQSGLTELADDTGGFLVKDTNDIKNGLSRIDEDIRFHYELSYVPKNSAYDGKFRQISVKLDRPGLEVQTRKGYFAVPSAGSPVLDYEVGALAALANSPVKNDAAIQAAAFSFPTSAGSWTVPVLVQAPADEFTYQIDRATNTYTTDFTIVALIKDKSGSPAGKLSQHYHISGAADKVEAAKRGEILFYREAKLPPGQYTVQTVAFDTATQKGDERTASVEVPRGDATTLRMGSVAVLQRVERLTEADKKVDNPFHYGEVLVYPNLGQPLSKATSKQMAFLCSIYPAKGATAPPKLDLKVLSAGNAIFDTSPALGPADPTGRVQYAGALPLDAFQPGTYVLQMTATDGHTSVSRSAQFTVRP